MKATMHVLFVLILAIALCSSACSHKKALQRETLETINLQQDEIKKSAENRDQLADELRRGVKDRNDMRRAIDERRADTYTTLNLILRNPNIDINPAAAELIRDLWEIELEFFQIQLSEQTVAMSSISDRIDFAVTRDGDNIHIVYQRQVFSPASLSGYLGVPLSTVNGWIR